MNEFPLKYIRSKYILKEIFDHIKKGNFYKIIQYNKSFQNRLEIGILDFKKYSELIEIELIPLNKETKNKFINIQEKDKPYFHIYFNDNINETRRNYFTKDDKINKFYI